jgi:hypothetical protein
MKALSVLWRALLAFALLPIPVAHADILVINQKIRDGGLQYAVNEVLFNEPVHHPPPPQGLYLELLGRVSNVGNLPLTYNAAYQNVVDKRGRVFAPTLWVPTDPELASVTESINPGNEIMLFLYFDVPTGSQITDYTLVWRESALSSSKTLKLVKSQG